MNITRQYIRIAFAAVTLGVSALAFAGAGGTHGGAPTSSNASAHASIAGTQPAHATGQPNQSCGSATAPNTPGNAANAPGSAFNPDGNAGTHYAGQQPQNSRNSASVSQYDVACSHQH